MYLRVTRGHSDPTKAEAVRQAVPAVIAGIKALPGCQDIRTGIDAETGETIAVSLFDTKAHASFARERLGEPLEQLIALGYTAEDPEIYEVL